MLDIDFLLTFPHAGTHSCLKLLNPKSYDAIKNISIDGFSKEKIDKLDTNYILLDSITADLKNFFGLIDRNRKNIIFGHLLSHNNIINQIQHINNIFAISKISKPIIPLRDPLLQLCSIYVRDIMAKSKLSNSKDIGGDFAGYSYWARVTGYGRKELHDNDDDEKLNKKIDVAIERESAKQKVIFVGEEKPWLEQDISFWLNDKIIAGNRKIPSVREDYLECSHNQMRNQIFMYEILSKTIDSLDPLYVPIGIERDDILYKDINFKNLPLKNTVKKTKHPLYEAYDNKDLLPIAFFLKDNLKTLIERQDTFKHIFKREGFEEFWWLK